MGRAPAGRGVLFDDGGAALVPRHGLGQQERRGGARSSLWSRAAATQGRKGAGAALVPRRGRGK